MLRICGLDFPCAGEAARGDTISGRRFPPVRGFPWPESIRRQLAPVFGFDRLSHVLARSLSVRSEIKELQSRITQPRIR